MSTIALHSKLNILETVTDRGLVPNDHQQEMAHGNQIIKMTSRYPDRQWSNYSIIYEGAGKYGER